MKINRIETITCSTYGDVIWVQVHTDEGLVGLGETWAGSDSVVGYIHQNIAPYLLGQDPLAIERHHKNIIYNTLRGMAHRGSGAEMRGLSAIDIALWDIYGQSVGLPIYQCLGGPIRESIRLYNTCVGGPPGAKQKPYESDYQAWQQGQAADLAQSLLEMGITAMKIWPFDQFSYTTEGSLGGRRTGENITAAQIEEGIKPFRQIREAVGMKMDIALEMHTMWNLPSAIRIAEAVDQFSPMWYEDPVHLEDAVALAEFAHRTRFPTTVSEYISTRYEFLEILIKDAVGVVMFDPGFIGGITEARRVANLAEAFHRPFAPHDCVGPVVFVVGVQLCVGLPNAMIQEGVRAHWVSGGWHHDVLTDVPVVERGFAKAPAGPGLGTRLLPDFASRPDVITRVSEL